MRIRRGGLDEGEAVSRDGNDVFVVRVLERSGSAPWARAIAGRRKVNEAETRMMAVTAVVQLAVSM